MSEKIIEKCAEFGGLFLWIMVGVVIGSIF